MPKFPHPSRSLALHSIAGFTLLAAIGTAFVAPQAKRDGPPNPKPPKPIRMGDVEVGRDVFRFETFGTEGFWTDAVRMPQGMAAKGVTMLAALKSGVSFDSEALTPELRETIARELKTDLSKANAPTINDPSQLPKLIGMNAVIGMVERNGKVGVTCALCHAITDKSMYAFGTKGSIGRRIDGPTPHGLEVGKLLALADNSRALYPTLQLDQGGKAIGRVAKYKLNKNSTEAQVDAYLNDPKAYPVGTFDDSPDGNGNSIHITPFFRQDLAAPFGSSGQNDVLDDFNNTVYTALFDQSNLLSSGGRKFMHALGGAGGDKISADYAYVLRVTGVKNYPYVNAPLVGKPGAPPTPTGKRVDGARLRGLNSYVVSLRAPKGLVVDAASVARGRETFRAQCTSCHNADSSKPVDARLIPLKTLWPAYRPMTIAKRMPPLDPIRNSPGTFDDKMVVVDASPGGGKRGNALPLLLDLARKPVFLKDDSVKGLESLLSPARGATAPHPYYVGDRWRRRDVVAFLRSLDDR